MTGNAFETIRDGTLRSGDDDNALEIISATISTAIDARVDAVDWRMVHSHLDLQGWSIISKLLTPGEAELIAGLYNNEEGFRSRIIMNQHGFGRGEYKYFSYPLPPLMHALRTAAYPHLAPIANRWHKRKVNEVRFPPERVIVKSCGRDARSGGLTPRVVSWWNSYFSVLFLNSIYELHPGTNQRQ
jgi:hypothetical protein